MTIKDVLVKTGLVTDVATVKDATHKSGEAALALADVAGLITPVADLENRSFLDRAGIVVPTERVREAGRKTAVAAAAVAEASGLVVKTGFGGKEDKKREIAASTSAQL